MIFCSIDILVIIFSKIDRRVGKTCHLLLKLIINFLNLGAAGHTAYLSALDLASRAISRLLLRVEIGRSGQIKEALANS